MVNINLERILRAYMFLFFAFFSIPLFGMQAAVGPQLLPPNGTPNGDVEVASTYGSKYSAPSNLALLHHIAKMSDVSVVPSGASVYSASELPILGSYVSAPATVGGHFGTETPTDGEDSNKSAIGGDWWGTPPPRPQAKPLTIGDYHNQTVVDNPPIFVPQSPLDSVETAVRELESLKAEEVVDQTQPDATPQTVGEATFDETSSSESGSMVNEMEESVDSDPSLVADDDDVTSLGTGNTRLVPRIAGVAGVVENLRSSAQASHSCAPHTSSFPSPPKATATDRSGSTQASLQTVSPTLYSQALTSEVSTIKSLQPEGTPKAPGQEVSVQHFNIAEQDSDAEDEYKYSIATPEFGNEGSTETEEELVSLDEVTTSEEQPEPEESEVVGVAAAG